MIKAIAVDDEPLALKVISNFCHQHPDILLAATFTRTDKALEFIAQHPPDLLFLDIQMPKITGIELLHKISPAPMVIFTTAYSEYAVEGFALNAVDYLLKPFTKERFEQAVQKAKIWVRAQEGAYDAAYLLLKADYGIVRVYMKDITYIEGWDDYVKIHIPGQKPLVIRITMKALLERLPETSFIRVHRSYIVALDKIDQVRNRVIRIGDARIAIGSSFEESFFRRFGKP
ncbi:MAG: DNA-binding response regulator [Bacteroidetes bacterium 47-18]|nr:MAG: DNA-binding response regulator [Bacteroidetes bacterium 47-18]